MGDVVFIGAPLWTDFGLFGVPEIAMRHARDVMSDYRRINWSKRPFSKLRPFHVLRKHSESVRFIEKTAAQFPKSKRVVVTHHAPSPMSIPQEHRDDLASAAYASDLERLVLSAEPILWVHGHIHDRQDYRIGRVRVVCNPRGYPDELGFEDFDPSWVVEI
jgi:Icc-related predicted phosphoesterase